LEKEAIVFRLNFLVRWKLPELVEGSHEKRRICGASQNSKQGTCRVWRRYSTDV